MRTSRADCSPDSLHSTSQRGHRAKPSATPFIAVPSSQGPRLDRACGREHLQRLEPRRTDYQREFWIWKTITSVAPMAMSSSTRSASSLLGTITETATYSGSSSGRMEGDFLPGVMRTHLSTGRAVSGLPGLSPPVHGARALRQDGAARVVLHQPVLSRVEVPLDARLDLCDQLAVRRVRVRDEARLS